MHGMGVTEWERGWGRERERKGGRGGQEVRERERVSKLPHNILYTLVPCSLDLQPHLSLMHLEWSPTLFWDFSSFLQQNLFPLFWLLSNSGFLWHLRGLTGLRSFEFPKDCEGEDERAQKCIRSGIQGKIFRWCGNRKGHITGPSKRGLWRQAAWLWIPIQEEHIPHSLGLFGASDMLINFPLGSGKPAWWAVLLYQAGGCCPLECSSKDTTRQACS